MEWNEEGGWKVGKLEGGEEKEGERRETVVEGGVVGIYGAGNSHAPAGDLQHNVRIILGETTSRLNKYSVVTIGFQLEKGITSLHRCLFG